MKYFRKRGFSKFNGIFSTNSISRINFHEEASYVTENGFINFKFMHKFSRENHVAEKGFIKFKANEVKAREQRSSKCMTNLNHAQLARKRGGGLMISRFRAKPQFRLTSWARR